MTALLPTALALLLQSAVPLLLGLIVLRLTQGRGPAVQTLIGRATLSSIAVLLLLTPLTGHVQTLWRVTLEPTPPRSYAFGITSYLAPILKQEGQEVGAPLAAPSSRGETETSPGPSSRGETENNVGAAYHQSMEGTHGAASSAPTPAIPALRPPLWGGPLRSKEVGSCAVITALLLLWLAVCQWHLVRLRRTATPLTSGPAFDLLAEFTPRPPQLLTHSSVRSPFLAGLARPAIFLPTTYAAEFDTPALRAILAHELAHRDRHDNAWTLVCRVLCALLWPQPLLWLLCRRLESIAEDACDQSVLAHQCPPRAYADCLLTLAERHPLPRRQRVLGAGVAPYRSALGRRIQRILTQGKQTMLPISAKLRLTIAALTLVAVLGGVCLVSSAPAQTTGTSAQAVVQQYIDALADGQYDKAYRLLSPANLTYPISLRSGQQGFASFQRGDDFSNMPRYKKPLFVAAAAFFLDTHNTLKAAYHVIGLDPKHQNTVLVATTIPGIAENQVLRIDMAPSEAKENGGQIDMMQSLHDTDLEAYIRLQDNDKRFTSLENLKIIGRGLIQYAEEHDEHYPAAARWMDAILPYVKNPSVFYDPFTPASQRYGYALNRTCSNQSLTKFDAPASTVMVFSSSLGTRNASDFGHSLRVSGHYRPGSAYVFADGHAKWFTQGRHPSFSLKGGDPIDTTSYSPTRAEIGKYFSGASPIVTPEVQLFAKPSEELSQARFLAGLTAVQGPGVIVTLNDSKQRLPGKMPAGMQPPNLIHDTDINQVVNELRAAGAEAIAVNGQRLVATSAVRTAGPTIYVNNVAQTPPYVIQAIGDSVALNTVLSTHGGIAFQIKSYDPAMFAIKNAPILTLPAYSEVGVPRYARPLTDNPPRKMEVKSATLTTLELRQQTLQLQVAQDQAARQQAAEQRQATYARLRAQGVFIQAAPDGSLRSVRVEKWKSPAPSSPDEGKEQIRILDQEIALQIAKIAQLEGEGFTRNHPAVVGANAQLQALEAARREAPIKAKQDFMKDVHAYSRRWVTLYNKVADSNLPLVAANRRLARDQKALKRLTIAIQTDNRLHQN